MPECQFCRAPVVKDEMGVWLDPHAGSSCTGSPTGFHHPEGAPLTAESDGPVVTIEELGLPERTVMFVIAREHGAYFSSMSEVFPGKMSKFEAAAMLHQIAYGWEQEAAQEIARIAQEN